LQRELELLRTARSHITAQRFDEAEATLARYRDEISSGELREEAAALAIETAFALDRPEARELANAFLTDFPNSPHSARAKELLAAP
jgi:hypothetical protein